MADFLTAVKTTVREGSEKQSENVLTAVSTRQTKKEKLKGSTKHVQTVREDDSDDQNHPEIAKKHVLRDAATPEDALDLLRSEPDTETLLQILGLLRSNDACNLHAIFLRT